MATSFLNATGSGDLARGIAVSASLDLAVFRERFRDWIDIGNLELAGQGKLDARYQRRGHDFEAGATAVFHDLRIGGLPVVGKVERRDLTLEGSLGGPAAASGWPENWRSSTLTLRSDRSSGEIKAVHDMATGALAVEAQAQLPRSADGRGERFEGELKLKWDGKVWDGERVAVSLVRDSKWGPGIGQDERIGWQGKGRYDPASDELVVESIAPREGARESTAWITGSQKARLTGLRSLGAAQIEATVNADLISISRLLAPQDQAWTGRIDALVQARRDRDLWNLGADRAARPRATGRRWLEAGDRGRRGRRGKSELRAAHRPARADRDRSESPVLAG